MTRHQQNRRWNKGQEGQWKQCHVTDLSLTLGETEERKKVQWRYNTNVSSYYCNLNPLNFTQKHFLNELTMLNEHKRRTTSPEASQMELRANRARTYASRSSRWWTFLDHLLRPYVVTYCVTFIFCGSARSLSPNNSSTNPRIFVPPKPSTRSRSSPWPSLSFGPVKEPSDFVKEVLLNTSDGANNPRVLEVITLFEQLQVLYKSNSLTLIIE